MFRDKHLLSVDQFDNDSLYKLFRAADNISSLVGRTGGDDSLKGKMMAALFYEPSSRTFGSFIAAMQRLGGGIIPIHDIKSSSVKKGESLPDTIRIFASYSDVIILRHPREGAARLAAAASSVPVINAGDGTNEHPTQALLDLYTIARRFSLQKELTIAMVGDLRFGRTVHSLAKLLAGFKTIRLIFISPKILRMPEEIEKYLDRRGIVYKEMRSFRQALKEADVVYMTRVQKERFDNVDEYNEVKNQYILDRKMLGSLAAGAAIMHPLPRINEISPDIDEDPRALYFTEQVRNGLYIRMALLKLIFKANEVN